MNKKKFKLLKINSPNKREKYYKLRIKNNKLLLKWKELNNRNKVREQVYKKELLIF